MPRSKVTSQCQISIPVEVRKLLGVGPGSVLEWRAADDSVTVRRLGTFSCEDIHRALFLAPALSPVAAAPLLDDCHAGD